MTDEATKRIEEEKKKKSGVLDLSHCGLNEIPAEVADLSWIKVLILSNVVDYDGIKKYVDINLHIKLNRLQSFGSWVQPNKIHHIPNIFNNLSLMAFCCSGDEQFGHFEIKVIENIEPLNKSLTYLDLNHCKLKQIKNLDTFENLKFLNLTYNQIKEINNLDNLENLDTLFLDGNQITDITNLDSLKKLIYLGLSDNKISKISGLTNLINLKFLNLRHNRNIDKIENLEKNIKIDHLVLNSCNIEKLDNIEHLSNLEYLEIHSNQIKSLEGIENLYNLKSIDAYSNQITNFEYLKLFDNLESLSLRGNPIKNIDQSIIFEYNCLKNLRIWHQELSKKTINKTYNICLLGDTRTGKSSLLDRLKYNTFDPNKLSSHAIILDTYNSIYTDLKITGDKDIKLQFFDFGGQDIYHGTHRWFLKGRHLNIILYNADQKDTADVERKSIEYWIKICVQNNPDNPILIVQSKYKRDGNQIPSEFDDLKKKYPQILSEISHIDSALDDISTNGFDDLKKSIGLGIQQVLGFEMEIPQSFDNARTYLIKQSKKNKEIDHEELSKLAKDTFKIGQHYDFDICYSLLLKWLQGVGVIFYNENMLGGRIILDQKWAIDAIYSLFKPGENIDRLLKKNKGQIKLSDIYEYLSQYNDYEKDLLINYLKNSYTVFEYRYNFYKDSNQRTLLCPRYLPSSNNLEISKQAMCTSVLEIEDFSSLDFIDLISVLNYSIHIKISSLSQTKYEFDFSGNCNAQIHYSPNRGICISTLEAESHDLWPLITNAIESLGLKIKDKGSKRHEKLANHKPTAKIFISYSSKYAIQSKIFIEKFKSFTKSHPDVKIDCWDDDQIFLGEDWHKRIQIEIKKSNLCILLLCQDFFNSEYIKNYELKNFLEQNEKNEYPILPVVLSDYVFQDYEAILEKQIFMPNASLFDDISGDKICFNKLIYHKSNLIKDAFYSPNVDTYFKQLRARLDVVLREIYSKLK